MARRRRKLRDPAAMAFPLQVERAYAARLQRRVRTVNALLMERLLPELQELKPDIDERARIEKEMTPTTVSMGKLLRGDAWSLDGGLLVARARVSRADGPAEDMLRLLEVVTLARQATETALKPSQPSLVQSAMSVDRFGSRLIETITGIDVFQPERDFGLYTAFARTNADLITTIDTRYFDDIAKVVTEGIREGKLTRDIVKDMQTRFSVSKNRAKLIARDQVGTLNAQLTRRRQTQAGIDKFKWVNSADERVRDEHQNAPVGVANRIYTWAEGAPEEGFPGEPIACRCVAVPVIQRAS